MKRLAFGLGLALLAPAGLAESEPQAVLTAPAPQAGQVPVVTLTPVTPVVSPRSEPSPLAPARLALSEPRAETGGLAERVAHLEGQLKSAGLLDLLRQIQVMREEIARLRGSLEELAHQQKIADKRQKDLFADLDERQTKLKADLATVDGRLQELASRTLAPKDAVRLQTSSSLAAAAPVPDAESEAKAYEAALNQFKVGNYTAAVEAFQNFLKLYPSGSFASNGHYWLGLSYFSLGDYKSAAAAQLRLLRDHPQSHKAPDAMVSLARAQIQLGELDAARNTLDQVLEKYPVTRAAESARKMQALVK
jgi:tol-pal system protein YbgF